MKTLKQKISKLPKKRQAAIHARVNELIAEADWLKYATGKGNLDWVTVVQDAIRSLGKPTKDPWHSSNDPAKVVAKIAEAVKKTWPKNGKFDGNMRMASTLGLVLCLWYLRVHRAKSYDPRRPVSARQSAYFQRHKFCKALLGAIIDESLDAKMFPGQKWETPFDPYPTDGYFV